MTVPTSSVPENFVKIALSHTFSEINAFLHFTQNFKMPTKCGGKMILAKKWTNKHPFQDV